MSTSTVSEYKHLAPPAGDPITMRDGTLSVPAEPIIPFIEGDGTGPDIWHAAQLVLDGAVRKAYGNKRRIAWYEVLAGEKSKNLLNTWLPEETVAAISKYLIVSAREFLPHPSAMVEAMESAERRSWLVMSRASGRVTAAQAR